MHDTPPEITEKEYTRYFKKYRIDIVEYQNGTKKYFPHFSKLYEKFSNGKCVGSGIIRDDYLTNKPNKGLDTYQEALEYINKDKEEDILNNPKVRMESIEIE